MTTDDLLACTLTPTDYATRIAWITALNRATLRSHHREGGRLRLAYSADAATQVHELVQREQNCCGFLRFTVVTGAEEVMLDVEVPDSAIGSAGDLLAPFLVGSMP